MEDLRYKIGKTFISATNPSLAKEKLKEFAKNHVNGYICISNTRTVGIANSNKEYNKLMAQSLMNTPDGMPLVWMAKLWGLKDVRRTMGPELMVAMLEDKSSTIKHFLLGDTEETLSKMIEKYPDSNIVDTFSPPFCSVDEYDYPSIAKRINESGADIVWFSLTSPKQDIMARRLQPMLDHKVCVGVGAAFRFSLGNIKQPPKIFQKLALTGLFWRKWTLSEFVWYVKHFCYISKWSADILYRKYIKHESPIVTFEIDS